MNIFLNYLIKCLHVHNIEDIVCIPICPFIFCVFIYVDIVYVYVYERTKHIHTSETSDTPPKQWPYKRYTKIV